jgi:hypothetical protein
MSENALPVVTTQDPFVLLVVLGETQRFACNIACHIKWFVVIENIAGDPFGRRLDPLAKVLALLLRVMPREPVELHEAVLDCAPKCILISQAHHEISLGWLTSNTAAATSV